MYWLFYPRNAVGSPEPDQKWVTLKIDQTNALERKDDQMGHFNAVK
jgi:hypothetical protein